MILRGKPTFWRVMYRVIGVALLFVSTSRAQQPAPADSKLPERPGTITGRVINSAGEPLSGATAYVVPIGVNSASQSAVVDTSGNFKVEGLDAGLYRVGASLPGYIYIPAPQPAASGSSYYHSGDSVTLTMIKGAVITGTVTSTNGPVIATSVRALRVRDDDGKALPSPLQMRERLTDDRGVYRLYGLPPGAYMIAAGGSLRFGAVAPSQYDNDTPTYFPSATRDTASEIIVRNGEEVTADIQYRGEPGHSISGAVAGFAQSQNQVSISSSIGLTDVRDRLSIMSVATSSYSNYAFAFYGVPDGEYELSASQFLPSRDSLRSEARRVKVRGTDVTGINLVLRPPASIEGRLIFENDPKAGCAKRRETAAQETLISARRYEPEMKPATTASKAPPVPEVPLLFTNYVADSVADAKGTFSLRNLPTGSYRIDPRAPASGWYVRSIAIGPAQAAAARNSNLAVARDGITLKSGERVAGLTVTITEGAGALRGHISVAEDQRLPVGLRVYLIPAEPDNAENVLRFFDAAAESDGSFAIGNVAPGRYWIIARAADNGEPAKVKPIRQDSALRAKVLREAGAAKKEISFQPCERAADYDLPYSLPVPPKP